MVSFTATVAAVPVPGWALPDPAGQCDRAARVAALESGVPEPVLAALMLTESGRRRAGALRPWPWTVNMQGAGHWFDDAVSAKAFAYKHFRAGARSFDVGCFQINYRWHHTAFASIEEMFDPVANARYAARFLSGLFEELGTWELAAGAYHSRTPDLARKYQARFARHHDAIVTGAPDAPRPVVAALPRRAMEGKDSNGYPLLLGGARGVIGSLMPAGIAAVRPLFATPEG
ncbi:MAG: transglycosylase SLT domain-containing protein [Rhodobacteraceae bacterium]|nr:transglycosylase SLT domain-containing protein [Paracoccaceae bacterium]